MANPFEVVRALMPKRSAFNLSHEVKFTCDMGQLIPTCVMEVVPGDHFNLSLEAVVRFLPLVAPILHEVNMFVHFFFIPYRLLFPEPNGWESFWTGGVNGTDATVLPTWIPTGGNVTNDNGDVVADNGVGSLWDFMGFPTGVIPAGAYPVSFPRRAYNRVFNEYYRDVTQDAEVGTDSSIVLNRRWEKDYLTSALPWQQRGTAPGLPITGSSSAVWASQIQTSTFFGADQTHVVQASEMGGVTTQKLKRSDSSAIAVSDSLTTIIPTASLNANTVNLGVASTVNVSDLRLAFQVQKWLERSARGGPRYIEQLRQRFGVSPRDERLNRAEFIGGTRMPVIVSEVLQTSRTDAGQTPQGTMAGHGLSCGRDSIGRYTAPEFGIIMGIMSIVPRSAYFQGIPRTWLKTTRYDYYSPEFAHLSEQAVINAEVFAGAVAGTNQAVFGYQGRFNELRFIQNRAASLMRPGVANSLAQWNLVRNFAALPGLNAAFMKCIPDKSRIMAVPTQPTCLVNMANIVKAVRPLPIEADPGLIDHA